MARSSTIGNPRAKLENSLTKLLDHFISRQNRISPVFTQKNGEVNKHKNVNIFRRHSDTELRHS